MQNEELRMRLTFLSKIVLVFLFSGLLFACSNKQKSSRPNQPLAVVNGPDLRGAREDSIPSNEPMALSDKTVIAEGLTFSAPVKLPTGTPLQVLNNRTTADTSVIVPITGTLITKTPGKDGLKPPDTLSILHIKLPAPSLEPFEAGPLQIRENAVGNIQYIGLEEGISHYFIYSVLEDRRGHIWFRDLDNTLNRYDGQKLTYLPVPKKYMKTKDYFQSILEDSEGNLWLDAQNGLVRFNGHEFSFFIPEKVEKKWDVSALAQDRSGNIWFATLNNGIARFDGNQFIHYTTEQGLPHQTVNDLIVDKANRIWIATEGGAAHLELSKNGNITKITSYTTDNGLIANNIHTVFEDRKKQIWFGTQGWGACRFDGVHFMYFTQNQGLCGNFVKSIFENSQGHILFANESCGLNWYDGQEIRQYSEHFGTISIHANVIAEDETKNIWVGTNEGLHRYGGVLFEHINFEKAENFLEPTGIAEDKTGKLWFAITAPRNDIGIIRFDNFSFSHLAKREWVETSNTKRSYIETLYKDNEQEIWLGERGKLHRTDGQMIQSVFFPGEWDTEAIWAILKDQTNRIWLGTENGLVSLQDEKLIRYDAFDGSFISSIVQDQKNDLWIGTSYALVKYSRDSIVYYTTKEGLPDDWITTLLVDQKDHLWVGTNGGLSCFDGEQFVNFTTKNGLIDNRIRSLVQDNDQRIWVGTQNGLSVLIPQAGNLGYRIYNFGKRDGIKQSDFNTNCAYLDNKNRIWWGKTTGVMCLDLNQLNLTGLTPRVYLNYIAIEQKFIDYRRLKDSAYLASLELGQILDQPNDSIVPFFNYPQSLSLPHNLNHLTFHFSGIDWASPDQLRFSYRIKNLDNNWSLAEPTSYADYRNLPPGTHTLEVKAIGTAQRWSEPITYTFTIRPPWWLTWWAYTLYGVAGLSLLSSLFLYQRRRYLLKNQLQLEHERAERFKELDQFKSRFYTNITHEFRTPLTVIKGMSERIPLEKEKNLIRRNTDRLLLMINQLLDLSKLDSQSLPIHWVQADVIPYLQYLTESCHSLADSKHINLAFFSTEENLVMDFDELKLQQILINLLSNALKFTPEYGSVKVIVSQQSEHKIPFLKLEISDTGRGIPTPELSHIFDRFYQVDNSTTRKGDGSGIGLALVKELVQLLEGKIEVESHEGEGSVFTVWLPVHQTAPVLQTTEWTTPELVSIYTSSSTAPAKDIVLPTNSELPQVLIIEDNADVRAYIQSSLQPNYTTLSARNGKEGVEVALEQIPDVILSDVMMPEMDGFEVCRRLKSDRRTSHIPIILLTAKATQQDKVEGLSQGADAYLTKPFNKEELLVRLENLTILSKRLRERITEQAEGIVSNSEGPEQQEIAFIREVNQIIAKNLSDELFDTHHLCRAMAMSRTQLYRKLKALTGVSTANYIRDARLQRAKSMLESTNLPVGEIALEVGFKDFSHFSRSFTKKFGFYPSETRK